VQSKNDFISNDDGTEDMKRHAKKIVNAILNHAGEQVLPIIF
jgi:hypothetical protein